MFSTMRPELYPQNGTHGTPVDGLRIRFAGMGEKPDGVSGIAIGSTKDGSATDKKMGGLIMDKTFTVDEIRDILQMAQDQTVRNEPGDKVKKFADNVFNQGATIAINTAMLEMYRRVNKEG